MTVTYSPARGTLPLPGASPSSYQSVGTLHLLILFYTFIDANVVHPPVHLVVETVIVASGPSPPSSGFEFTRKLHNLFGISLICAPKV